jgi:hypothetical protein
MSDEKPIFNLEVVEAQARRKAISLVSGIGPGEPLPMTLQP